MKRFVIGCLLLVLLLALNACGSSDKEQETPENTPVPIVNTPESDPVDTQAPEPIDTVEPVAVATVEESEPPKVEVQETISLVQVVNEGMGISGLVPEEWKEVATGAYARGNSASDITRLIQQAAPGMGIEELSSLLLQQLGVSELPESYDTIEAGALLWALRQFDVNAPGVGTIRVDLALSETDEGTYIVLLQTSEEEYDALHEAVFLPSVDAFSALGEDDESLPYEDPNGLYSVPVPTSWRAEDSGGYATLSSPNKDIVVRIVEVESDDPGDAIARAWETVDPDFDRAISNVTDIPPSAVGGVDEYIVIDYDWDQGEQPIVQAEGRLFEDKVYVLLYVLDLEAAQQRASQIQILSGGFVINDLEVQDLTGVEPLPFGGELVTDFESFITEKMEQFDVPGASVAVVQDGQLVYSNGFGVTSEETGEPVTPETMMMIGSTTKSLTTMLMAQLVDEGIFDWDTRAVDILPTFKVADAGVTDQITMRNLVCACTGVPRRDLEWLFNSEGLTAERIIESLEDFEFFTDFGEAFQYSNQMVAAGGYLATLANGAEYGQLQEAYIDLLEERVLDPIGMENSTFSFDEILANRQYAIPHGLNLTGETVEIPLEYETSLIPLAPAGALWSNVIDMSNYLLTELNGGVSPSGERLVSAENLAVTLEPQVDISAEASYGLGWIIEDYDGITVISHAGNTFGYSSEFAFVPSANLGISVLTNQQGSAVNPFIRSWLFEQLFQRQPETEEMVQYILDRREEGLFSIRRSLVDSIEESEVQPYLGQYENDALGSATIYWENSQLIFDVGEFRNEIRALRNNGEIKYSTSSPPFAGLPVKFEMDESGNPTAIVGLGVVEYTFHKTG
jgi:CubicO group peptidase (beta-lactamase class C family)